MYELANDPFGAILPFVVALYGTSAVAIVWPVVVFVTTTWSVHEPAVEPFPALKSSQLTVTFWLDCGLVGLMARLVTRRSGATVVLVTVVSVTLAVLNAGSSAAVVPRVSPV